MNDDLLNALKSAAVDASAHAYCPYSGFRVGAAVLGDDGTIFSGANVENSSYGLTTCAERVAVFHAVVSGVRHLATILIYTPTRAPTAPCGACRQVIREFAPNATIISVCDNPETRQWTAAELLPESFGPDSLHQSDTTPDIVATAAGRPRICIDIDNVIAQSDVVMRTVIRGVTRNRVDLTYEDVVRFNYWECRDRQGNAITRDEWALIHDTFSEPQHLGSVEPVPGVQEQLKRLSDHFVLHFATSRLPTARRSTIEWLERHRFPPHDLHFLKHGEKHISLGRFEASVEDDPSQAEAFASAGFGINFVIAHPWNREVASTATLCRVSQWCEIVDALCTGE